MVITIIEIDGKALKDISNQAYRHIIHSLQELAQMSSDEGEPAAQSVAGDNETRTLAEATLLPMNRKPVETFYCLHINMPPQKSTRFLCSNGN